MHVFQAWSKFKSLLFFSQFELNQQKKLKFSFNKCTNNCKYFHKLIKKNLKMKKLWRAIQVKKTKKKANWWMNQWLSGDCICVYHDSNTENWLASRKAVTMNYIFKYKPTSDLMLFIQCGSYIDAIRCLYWTVLHSIRCFKRRATAQQQQQNKIESNNNKIQHTEDQRWKEGKTMWQNVKPQTHIDMMRV